MNLARRRDFNRKENGSLLCSGVYCFITDGWIVLCFPFLFLSFFFLWLRHLWQVIAKGSWESRQAGIKALAQKWNRNTWKKIRLYYWPFKNKFGKKNSPLIVSRTAKWTKTACVYHVFSHSRVTLFTLTNYFKQFCSFSFL